jgi:hypothetical protein
MVMTDEAKNYETALQWSTCLDLKLLFTPKVKIIYFQPCKYHLIINQYSLFVVGGIAFGRGVWTGCGYKNITI